MRWSSPHAKISCTRRGEGRPVQAFANDGMFTEHAKGFRMVIRVGTCVVMDHDLHGVRTFASDTRDHAMRILILNGPNLDLLGSREPAVYGTHTFDEALVELRAVFPGVEIEHRQSNEEGQLVSWLRGAAGAADGVILNPAGYSHTSVAIRDSIAVIDVPVVEVHISNIHAREEFRHNTLTGAVCAGVITGFGLEGYRLAVLHLMHRAHRKADRSS